MVFDLRWEVAGEPQLHRRFVGLERSFADFREPFREMMGVVEEEVAYQFDQEGEPEWEDLTDAYAERKRRIWGDQPIMVASGKLRKSLTNRRARGALARVNRREMRRGTRIQVGSSGQWNLGLIHQLGAPNVPREGGGGLPPRPMLRLRESAQRRLVRIFHDFFYAAGEGAGP